jgi:hypothetical protein
MSDFVEDAQPWSNTATGLINQGGWEMPGQSWLWNLDFEREQQSEMPMDRW